MDLNFCRENDAFRQPKERAALESRSRNCIERHMSQCHAVCLHNSSRDTEGGKKKKKKRNRRSLNVEIHGNVGCGKVTAISSCHAGTLGQKLSSVQDGDSEV